MASLTRRALALTCTLTATALLTACGSTTQPAPSAPAAHPEPVATVSGTPIQRSDFTHWMTIAAAANNTSPAATVTIPIPPDYTACVTTAERAAATAKRSPSQDRAACAQQYTTLLTQTMQFLITGRWLTAEATQLHITYTAAQIDTAYNSLKSSQFKTTQQFTDFLAASHQTVADLKLRTRLSLIQNAVRQHAVAAIKQPASAQIAAFYRTHRKQLAKPQQRDLRIVLTRTRAAAHTAERRIRDGESFALVAKQLSVDTTRSSGGLIPHATRATVRPAALSTAAFSAPLKTLRGPIRTPAGYYLLEVTHITPAGTPTLSQDRTEIQGELLFTAQQAALTAFSAQFQNYWTARTVCASGFLVSDCRNIAPAR